MKTTQEVTELVNNLSIVHLNLPTLNPSRSELYRQYVLDAVKELTLFQLREQQMMADVKELSELRASSKTMKQLIRDLEQKLSGSEATTATVSAGSQQRGVAGESGEG
jgi:hypothetical protein